MGFTTKLTQNQEVMQTFAKLGKKRSFVPERIRSNSGVNLTVMSAIFPLTGRR